MKRQYNGKAMYAQLPPPKSFIELDSKS